MAANHRGSFFATEKDRGSAGAEETINAVGCRLIEKRRGGKEPSRALVIIGCVRGGGLSTTGLSEEV